MARNPLQPNDNSLVNPLAPEWWPGQNAASLADAYRQHMAMLQSWFAPRQPQLPAYPADAGQYLTNATPLQNEISPGTMPTTRQIAAQPVSQFVNPATGQMTAEGMQHAQDAADRALAMGGVGPSGGGFRAFHGSPHDFSAFDLSKIGTGEGAQAYGHGMYLADAEGVAEGYKQALSRRNIDVSIDNQPVQNWRQTIDDINTKGDWRFAKLIDEYGRTGGPIEDFIRQGKDWYRGDKPMSDALEQFQQRVSSQFTPGHIYEVQVNADPAHFLDWDKPLSEQHPVVQQALKDAGAPSVGLWKQGADGLQYHSVRGQEGTVRPYDRGTGDGPEFLASYDTLYNGRGSQRFKTQQEAQNWIEQSAPIEAGRGADIYGAMRAQHPDDASVSAALQQAGIPGIRYLDAGSRGVGEGSRNTVVFSPEIMEVIRKYGLAGLMAGGMGAAGLQDQIPSGGDQP